MRFDRLELRCFGHFRDTSLSFPPHTSDFHIIYGNNEAGKSTALRAIEYLLFGFPKHISDDFLYPRTDLRIGATLSDRQGRSLSIVRRKGIKRTLRDLDDDQPIDAADLESFLRGVDHDDFRNRFGLSYERLVAGGRSLIEGGGDIGEALFAAGSGLAGLKNLRQQLESEVSDLFTPRGRTQRIAAHLAAIQDTKQELLQATIPAARLLEQQSEYQAAVGRRDRLRQQLAELRSQRNRAESYRRVKQYANKRRGIARDLEPVADAPELDESFSERRREQTSERDVSGQLLASLQPQRKALRAELDSIVIDEAMLAHAGPVEQLAADLATYKKAVRCRPALEQRLTAVEQEMQRLVNELGEAVSIEQVDSLVYPPQVRQKVQNALDRYAGLVRDVERTTHRTRETRRELQRVQAQLESRRTELDPRSLQNALRSIGSPDQLVDAVAEAESAAASLRNQAENRARRLAGWAGGIEEFVGVTTPLPSTIDQIDADLAEAVQRLEQSRTRAEEMEQRRDKLQRNIDRQHQVADLPSIELLHTARQRRDHLWRFLRRARRASWDASQLEPAGPLFRVTDEDIEPIRQILEEFEAQSIDELEDLFQESIRHADQLADRLRNEAEAVARLQADRHALAELEETLAAAAAEIERATAHVQRVDRRWRDVWKKTLAHSLSPAEARQWVDQHNEILRLVEQSDQQSAVAEQNRAKIESATDRLVELAGVSPPQDPIRGFVQLVDEAAIRLDQMQQQREESRALSALCGQLQQQDERAQEAARQAAEQLEQWSRAWEAIACEIGLPANSDPTLARQRMDTCGDLLSHKREQIALQQQLEENAVEVQSFTEELEKLVARVASDLEGIPATEAVPQLAGRLAEVRENQRRKLDLEEQLKKIELQIEQANGRRRAAEAALAALCAEAACELVEELPSVEQRSRKAHQLRVELAGMDRVIGELAGNNSPDQLLADAEQCDQTELELECERLDRELSAIESQYEEAAESAAVLEDRLRHSDTSERAASLQERLEEQLAELAVDTRRWCRLRLAQSLLDESIQRYRRQAQGPVLQRASVHFQRLTRAAMAELRADFDEQGKGVLCGVRPDGGVVTVGGMSDGTADQLYLSLRVAALELHFQSHGPTPVIIDDVLINFDDDRTRAALQVLLELSQQTQVIFFTHHRRVVELARSLGESVAQFYELG